MMDAYHPDFREGSIALDSRLQGLLKAVGKPGTGDYEDSEDFLLKVAEIAGIEAWELDRLLFNKKWKDEVLELFRASAAHIRRT